MKRTHYRNGDEISLHTGCDGCSPAVINGVFCHERGCPEAWRDSTFECFECGCDFPRTERNQNICEGCANPVEEDTEDYCDCGELLDHDCHGRPRCPACDEPCPYCRDN